MADYYEILGVKKDATESQINQAFREKALLYHPDKNKDKDATEKFKQAAEAYEVLGDPERRVQYDRQQSGFGGLPFSFGFGDGFFNNMFGHHGPMGRSRFHATTVETTLTFQEAILGCRKDILVKTRNKCACNGGVKEWQTCGVCHGSGKQVLNQAPFVIQTVCGSCGGNGKTPKVSCSDCGGTGYKGTVENTVSIDIPPGVEDNTIFAVQQAGEVDLDGRKVDLHVKITVQPHPFYSRNGNHIFCHVPVTYSQLFLGDEITVPTLTGDVKMTVPPRTTAGKKLRLRGMGVPKRNGDMYAVLELKFPEADKEYENMVKKLAKWEKSSAVCNMSIP